MSELACPEAVSVMTATAAECRVTERLTGEDANRGGSSGHMPRPDHCGRGRPFDLPTPPVTSFAQKC